MLLRDFKTWVKFREKNLATGNSQVNLDASSTSFLFNLWTQNVNLSFLNDFCRPPLDLTHVN